MTSARSLSIGLLLFGMLWILVMLMQDFDLAGGKKAILLLGLAVATIAVTRVVEGGALSARSSAALLAGLGIVLAVLAILTPSRLSAAETLAAIALAVAPLALRAVGVRSPVGLDRLPAILTALCVVLALNRLRFVFAYLHAPDMEDIGRTTIAAIQAVFTGHNPYATPLDLHPEYPDYPGYKYLPMMMAVYAPLVSAFGETGLRLMNLVLDAGVSAAILLSARRIGGPVAGLLALAAWLMLPVLPQDIYKHGVTDLAPVLPLVAAMILAETRLGRAGLLIGLSVAAKLFPGLLMALCCLRRRHVAYYFTGGFVGILPAVAFYLWGPADFTRNVFQFILSRPMDETSWMFGAPPIIPMAAKLGYFLFLLGVLAYLVAASPGMVRRCGLIVLAVIGALLTGPDAHNNYMIWWAPFFCILLGSLAASIVAGREIAA
jgi:Glycosyltransferase family 87